MTIPTPMQREAVFNQGGSYGFIVQHDILLHREATAMVLAIAQQWLAQHPQAQAVRILDLACGGTPVITGNVMARLASQKFNYVGIDINADQISAAQHFPFSKNVHVTVRVGNSWELNTLQPASFDLVFEGLNTHHATPEELQYFAQHLAHVIKPGGLFMNYDLFRPTQYPYLHRPDSNSQESLRLIPHDTLQHAGITETTYPAAPDWRDHHFLPPYIQLMQQKGLAQDLIDQTVAHIRERDYPVTALELCKILMPAGFTTQIYNFQRSKAPMKDFLSLVVAQKT